MGFRIRRKLRGELKWRYFAPGNTDRDNPMLEVSGEGRKSLSIEFANIIASSPVTIISCVTDVEMAFEYGGINSQSEFYHFSYKPLSERFQYFLQDVDSLGIIVADHRGRDDDRLFRAHHESLVQGAKSNSSKYTRFVEGLFLQDSCHSIGIQMADYVAGAIHRAYCTKDTSSAAILKPRIRCKPSGSILGHGIVHHPKERFRRDIGFE